jgi:uncharacterized protein
VKAFFFGEPARQLFGVHHPADGAKRRGVGVVLCYPGHVEYNRSHRAFRNLAGLLAAEGFDALRFDYFATGDSAGTNAEGDPEIWIGNIETACQELRDRASVSSISLVGLRLGALLAVHASARRGPVRDLVLWEPVAAGETYVRDLERVHRRQNLVLLHPSPNGGGAAEELTGYAFPLGQRRAIEQLGIANVQPKANRIAIISSGGIDAQARETFSAWKERMQIPVHIEQADEAGASDGGARESIRIVDKALGVIVRGLVGDQP